MALSSPVGGGIVLEHDDKQVAAASAAFARGEVSYDEHAPAGLPPVPESEPMVSRGVRLPVSIDRRIRDAAERANVPFF